mmetsp:Transcript_18996/g.34263  ORF Transcript_18996/g.34263 Transcript_18996/m.34263 type:complete len:206 (+) Transcript_18996:226-843(+)
MVVALEPLDLKGSSVILEHGDLVVVAELLLLLSPCSRHVLCAPSSFKSCGFSLPLARSSITSIPRSFTVGSGKGLMLGSTRANGGALTCSTVLPSRSTTMTGALLSCCCPSSSPSSFKINAGQYRSAIAPKNPIHTPQCAFLTYPSGVLPLQSITQRSHGSSSSKHRIVSKFGLDVQHASCNGVLPKSSVTWTLDPASMSARSMA